MPRGAGVALAAALAFVVGLLLSAPAAAAPGNPGVPGPPTVVFQEDFENVPNPAAAQLLADYTGAAPTSMTYTAHADWLNSAACNGVISAWNATATAGSCPSGIYNAFVRPIARGMGAVLGGDDDNQVMSDVTISGFSAAQTPAATLETETAISLPSANRYITFSIDAGAVTCGPTAAHPLLRFFLLNGGQTLPVSNNAINACTDPRGSTIPPGQTGAGVRVGSYASDGSLFFTGNSLGVKMTNDQTSGSGNDYAVDNLRVLDATPQLDKVFASPTPRGEPTTLTFTITNTSDLAAKEDWSFTDTLPAGLEVADPAGTTTNCTNGSVAAVSGGDTIEVSGDLETNRAFCTVTVDVVAAEPGDYENCAENVSDLVGLDPPGCSTLTVQPVGDLAITKDAEPGPHNEGELVNYTLTVTNNGPDDAEGVEVLDDLPAGLSFVSATPEQGTCSTSDPIDCDLGTIGNSDSVEIEVVAEIAAGQGGNALVNTATVDAETPDTEESNNSADAAIDVEPEDGPSFLAKRGFDPTTNSTAASGGPSGTTAAGDVLDWVVSYRNQTGSTANVNITDPITGNHRFVPGSLQAPPGLDPHWSTDGGVTYGSPEPGSGVNGVGATGTSVPGSTGAQVQASPPPPSAIPAPGAGDGFEALFLGDNVYNVFHHRGGLSGSTPIPVLDCHVRVTGARCDGYPTYVSPNAGDAFGTGPSTLTTGVFNQAAVSGDKIYYPVGVIGTRNDGVLCANVVTQTSCGFFQLGSYTGGGTNPNSSSATINGGAVMGTRYYTVSHDGEIYCFDVSTETACQGYAPTLADPNAPALRQHPHFNLQAWDERYLFGSFARSNIRDLICIDTTTNTRCPGFPKYQYGGIIGGGNLHDNTMAPILDAAGELAGICAVAAQNTTSHPFACFDLNGTSVSTPFSETQTSGTGVNWVNFGSIAVVGSRLYFAETVPGNGRATYTCWDYSVTPSAPGKIGNVCPGFVPASTDQDVRPYTIRQDPQNPECLWMLGDRNRFEIFSATFGGTGCRFGNAVVELTPEDLYCDGTEGHVSGWEAIRLGGLTSADYDGVAVTITDSNGNPVPGWQNRSISNASQTIDISSIPYDGSTTTLNIAVAVSWGSKPVKPVTVTSTFDGDPPQVCFQTRVRAAECTEAQEITNEANAITNAGPGNSDAPGGNDSGPATFVLPADPAACRADLELAKTTDAANGAVAPGGAVTWTLTVTNNGPDASTGSTVTDLLPAGLTNLATATPGCEIEGSLLTCEVGALDPDGTAEIVVTGNAPQASSTCFENAASVVGNEADPEESNDEASVRTCTNAAADLELTKTATPQLMDPGDPLTYTLTVTNNGPDPSTGSTVTDTLPGNLTNVQVPGNCDLQGTSLTCTVDALDPDDSTDIVITADAPDTAATCFTNAASVDGAEGDPVAANDQDSVRACTTPNADLELSKTAAEFVDPGGQVTWTLTVTNNGTADSSGATVTDALPTGITGAATETPGCSIQDNVLTCQVAALDADASTDIVVTGNAPDAPSTCFSNDASVEGSATESDPDPENNDASARTCTREADLELEKAIDDDLVSPGTGLVWTITVTNNGPDQSSAATVTDTLPDGVTNVATQDPRCEVSGNTITCDIDPLDDEESTDIVITADAPDTSSTCFENAAAVESTGGDLTEGNNSDSVRACTTPIANLELTKSAPAVVDPGGQVTWTIRATNRGPDPSTGLTVTDTLPSEITDIQAPGCEVDGQTIACTSDLDLAVDEFVEFQITGTAPNTGSTCFENAASVEGERGDPDLTDNEASAETCTNEGADIEVQKTAGPGPHFAGDNVNYTLAVKNNGPATAHDVTLDDDLPDSLSLVSATPEQGDCNDADPLQCTLGTIPSGETVDVTLIATIGADQSGTEISNTACAAGTEPDPFEPNDCDTRPVTVQSEVDLELTKVADPGPYSAGDEVTYTLTVTNNGPNVAPVVTVDDDLPGALALTSATPSQGTCSSSDPLHCELGEIAVSDTVEIEVVARVGNDQAGNEIENTACTASLEFDPDESNNCDTEPIEVAPPPPSGKPKLVVSKRASTDEAHPGEVISYRIVVRNKGKAEARKVKVCDKLPTGLKVLDAPGADTSSSEKVCWKLKRLKAGGKRKFKVVAQIAFGAKAGEMKNKAIVDGRNARANRDAAEVDIQPVGGPCPSVAGAFKRC